MADTASLIARVSVQGADKAAKDLDRVGQSATKVEPKMNALKTSLGNAGYQVQDFIVQIQSGQSALVAFTQQGSQLVSAFNPIAGVALTVATVVGGALYNSLTNATDSTKQLEDATKFLDDTLSEATPGVYDMNDAMEKLEAIGASAAEKMAFLDKAMASAGATAVATADKVDAAFDKLLKNQSLVDKLTGALAQSQIAQRDPLAAVNFEEERRAELLGISVKEMRSLEIAQRAVNAGVPGAREGAVAYLDSIKAKSPEAQMEINKLRNELNYLGVEEKSHAAQRKGIENADQNYEKAKAERAQKELDRQERIGAAAQKRADTQAAAVARQLASEQKAADTFLATLARQNTDQIAAINATEQQKLATLEQYNQQGLYSAEEYETAKTQIVADAEVKRGEALASIKAEQEAKNKELYGAEAYIAQLQASFEGESAEIDRQYKEKQKKLDYFHSKGLVSEADYQASMVALQQQATQQKVNNELQGWATIAGNAAGAMDQSTAAYKAFAIAQATISTYLGATKALADPGGILGMIQAGLIVATGLANVATISGVREQGGMLNPGGSYLVGERGPEIIRTRGGGSVSNASDTRKQLAGNNTTAMPTNVTIVNNTSAAFGNVSAEQDDEGRLRLIISEQVASELQNSNSKISKARKATRNAPGFR